VEKPGEKKLKNSLSDYLRGELSDPRRQRTLSVRKPMNDQETLSVERGVDSVQRPCSASLSSPALKHQSEIYPPRYRGRVPWKIKMACTVRPDLEWLCKTRGTVAVMDEVYECWVNMHGAVAAICRNGEKLGIKPAEFDVVEWHTQTPNVKTHRQPVNRL
jgi:hypothetical protein